MGTLPDLQVQRLGAGPGDPATSSQVQSLTHYSCQSLTRAWPSASFGGLIMPLALCDPITFGCDWRIALRPRPYQRRTSNCCLILGCSFPSPQPRPINSDLAQAQYNDHSRATGRRCRRAASRGWRQTRQGSRVTGAQSRPLAPPQAQVQGRGRDYTNDIMSSPSRTRITPAPTCVPHTRRPKQEVLRPDGLELGAAAATAAGACGIESGMGPASWNPAARPALGQAPPHSNQALEPGAGLPLKPRVWGQPPHPAPESRHGTWNS